MYNFREYPSFSWSHSRDRLFRECARKYYWQYYGSHNGWLSDSRASDDARRAYQLKNLTTLHIVLGQEVHECCKDAVLRIKNGKNLAPPGDLAKRLTGKLRHVCACSKDVDSFVRSPKRNPMIQSYYFTNQWNDDEVETVRYKMERIIANFFEVSIWEELQDVHPNEIQLVEKLDTISYEGLPLYAAPDLVVMPEDRCEIVDWKTGENDELAEDQLALYALFVERKLGVPFEEGKWCGRVVNLLTGSDTRHTFTKDDLSGALERIEKSVTGMRAFLLDVAANRPMAEGDFPLAAQERRYRCPSCQYYPLCSGELGELKQRFEDTPILLH